MHNNSRTWHSSQKPHTIYLTEYYVLRGLIDSFQSSLIPSLIVWNDRRTRKQRERTGKREKMRRQCEGCAVILRSALNTTKYQPIRFPRWDIPRIIWLPILSFTIYSLSKSTMTIHIFKRRSASVGSLWKKRWRKKGKI